ncbi:MAG: histidine phosphatase family protein [Anaerolineae bacterium]
MEVYLIRHAQSTNQVLDNRDDVVFDPHLTDLGKRQATLLAEHLVAGEERTRFVGNKIDRLACSPMWRALQTTQPIAEALDLAPEVWVDVHEQVLTESIQPGGTREEILRAFPDVRLPEDVAAGGWWNQGAETRSACMERAIRVAGKLWRRADDGGENLAIVSHARFIDVLLKALLDQLPSHEIWYHHSNTAVSRVALSDERVEIRYLNRVDHLSPELVS